MHVHANDLLRHIHIHSCIHPHTYLTVLFFHVRDRHELHARGVEVGEGAVLYYCVFLVVVVVLVGVCIFVWGACGFIVLVLVLMDDKLIREWSPFPCVHALTRVYIMKSVLPVLAGR